MRVTPVLWVTPLTLVTASVNTLPAAQAPPLTAGAWAAAKPVTITGYGFGLSTVTVTVPAAPGYRSGAEAAAVMCDGRSWVDWALPEPVPVPLHAANDAVAA